MNSLNRTNFSIPPILSILQQYFPEKDPYAVSLSAGLSPNYLYRQLLQGTTPSIGTCKAFAKVLKIPTSSFVALCCGQVLLSGSYPCTPRFKQSLKDALTYFSKRNNVSLNVASMRAGYSRNTAYAMRSNNAGNIKTLHLIAKKLKAPGAATIIAFMEQDMIK